MEMTWTDRMNSVGRIYEKLDDEESRFIWEQRLDYLVNRDAIKFWNNIKAGRDWVCPNKRNNFIIFGAGELGGMYLDILERTGKNVVAFCDNYRGGNKGEKKIMTVERAIKEKVPIVIPDGGYYKEARRQLTECGLEEKYIMLEPDIRSYTGIQYFDVWIPRESEIFVDCGAYDGDTIEQFIKWTDSAYEKIYAFEPTENNYRKIKNKKIRDCELFNKATWSSSQELKFVMWEFDTGNGVHNDVSEDRQDMIKIEGISIDEALHGDKVTFIKMDVEGSELESLKGAKKTIRKYKPRLALAVYHRPEDIFDIPNYILSLNSEYKFKLRHYSSGIWETVLYAE